MQRRIPLDRPTRTTVAARMDRLFPSRACLPVVAAALLELGTVSASHAATIVVNSIADPGDATTCTLRQAIVSMNTGALVANSTCTNTGSAFGSGDTVNFAASLFSAGSPTVTLADQPGNYLNFTDSMLTVDAGAGRNVTVQRSPTAQNKFSVFSSYLGGNGNVTMHLSGLTVRNGYADNKFGHIKYGPSNGILIPGGGGIAVAGNLILDHCTVANNVASVGAGIWATRDVSIDSSTIIGNSAVGVTCVRGNHCGMGGGVATFGGNVVISNSTISGNASDGEMGAAAIGNTAGDIQIINSTISGNYVGHGQEGGAAITVNGGITLVGSTIACNNSLYALPAIGIYASGFEFTAISAIFADTSNALCATRTKKEMIVRSAVSGDHNLVVSSSAIDSSSPFPADTIVGDPLLGPLQNNGGPTLTHALGAGSPAIDAGSNPANLSYDQRIPYFSRWVGKAPDIGAYEVQTAHLCGTANGHSFVTMSASTPNLCSAGVTLLGGPYGSGPWTWFCGPSSSNDEFCGAQVLASTSLLIENASGGVITSAVWGQPLNLKAVAAGSGTGPTPTGTMSFFDVTGGGFAPICVNSPILNGSGGTTVCDTTNSPIDAGARQLEAVYNGDGTYGAASSSPGGIQINPAASTTSVLSQTPNPVSAGSPFTVVAKVTTNAPSQGSPSGIVQITDQTDNLTCTYPLGASTPGCAITPRSLGVHSLLVAYPGNNNIGGSSIASQETVNDVIFRNGFEATN